MPRSNNVTMHLTEESIDIIMEKTAYSREELKAKMEEAEARNNICVFVFPEGAFNDGIQVELPEALRSAGPVRPNGHED